MEQLHNTHWTMDNDMYYIVYEHDYDHVPYMNND